MNSIENFTKHIAAFFCFYNFAFKNKFSSFTIKVHRSVKIGVIFCIHFEVTLILAKYVISQRQCSYLSELIWVSSKSDWKMVQYLDWDYSTKKNCDSIKACCAKHTLYTWISTNVYFFFSSSIDFFIHSIQDNLFPLILKVNTIFITNHLETSKKSDNKNWQKLLVMSPMERTSLHT